MAIYKYNRNKGYESISRDFLQNNNLSLQARGLLAYMISMPEDYVFHKTQLQNCFAKNKTKSVNNAWNELLEENYIVAFKKREGMKYNYKYFFDQVPFTKEDIENLILKMNEIGYELIGAKNKKKTEPEKLRKFGEFLSNSPKNSIGKTPEVWGVPFEQSKMNSSKGTVNKLNIKRLNIKTTNDTNESYESQDNDKLQVREQLEDQRQHHFVMRNNGEDTTRTREQFEDQRQLTNKLPKENIYDYTKQGLPQNITDLIYTFSRNDIQDFKNIIGCIFKAKSHVSKHSKNTIFLEDLAEEDFLELHKVIYRCLHERKTNPNLRNFEGYLMAALIRYFENYGEADIPSTMEFTVPINNWTKEYKDNEQG
ncbi:hypothetical protein SAMN05421767_15811 [Granulicatella balaenopterae]|uniref:Replication initiator protein A C-terminal domain-containing protein n=2 Tax=Granulicatella balaenopterae TaxID=137733 RepID=A0A1H9PHY3_9LACT|nr:hypothetical protein [Granulicatella balaenopterae]SER47475.1 hypothetical protein SAMN05421767_15811 [Granulicatella balaenopterae]